MALYSSTDTQPARMRQLFGPSTDYELDGLNGFKFKSFLKKAGNVLKTAAPLVLGVINPALGVAAGALLAATSKGGGAQAQSGPEMAPQGAPGAGPGASAGRAADGGGIVLVGVGLLALVMLTRGRR